MTGILHVSGLGWSGSGAVLDLLLDADHFLSLKGKPQSVSESRLFSGRSAIPDVVASLPRVTGVDVLALWTAGARSGPDADTSGPVRRFLKRTASSHAVNRKVFRTVPDAELFDAAEAAAAALSDSAPNDRSSVYLQQTYTAMRVLLGSAGRPLLIDNDPGISARIMRHLDADPEVRFVTVVRDPADQYVDRRAKAGAGSPVPVDVARTLASAVIRRRELTMLARAAAARPGRVFVVAFERFVHDATYRDALLDVLLGRAGSLGTAIPTERFIPERSQGNVGLRADRRDRLALSAYRAICSSPHARTASLAEPPSWGPKAV